MIYSYPFSDTFTIPAAASCFLSLNHCFCPRCYYILSCFCFATDDNRLKIECFFASCFSSPGTQNNKSFVISHRAISLMDWNFNAVNSKHGIKVIRLCGGLRVLQPYQWAREDQRQKTENAGRPTVQELISNKTSRQLEQKQPVPVSQVLRVSIPGNVLAELD